MLDERDERNEPEDPADTDSAPEWPDGVDAETANEMLPLILDELRRLARVHMRGQPSEHTLQPTALVNEAYLRLFGQKTCSWESRRHFLRVASRAMRSVLVDHARAKNRQKRTPIQQVLEDYERLSADTLALDEALRELASNDAVAAQIIELRFYAGATEVETSRILDIPLRSVQRKWSVTRAWLKARLG